MKRFFKRLFRKERKVWPTGSTSINVRFKRPFRNLKSPHQILVRQTFSGNNDFYRVQGTSISMLESEWKVMLAFGDLEIR